MMETRTWNQMKKANEGAAWIVDGKFCNEYENHISGKKDSMVGNE